MCQNADKTSKKKKTELKEKHIYRINHKRHNGPLTLYLSLALLL